MYTLLQQGIPILAPFFHTHFDLSLAGLGILVSSFSAGLVISSIPSGALVDRVGERWSVTAGAAVGCCLVLATLLVQHQAWAVGALLFLAGLLSGTVGISSSKSVFGWFDPRERGLAMGVRQIAIPAGAAIGAISLPLLGTIGGWQLPLTAIASAQLASAAIFLVCLKAPPGGNPARAQTTVWHGMAGVLRDPPMVLAASLTFVLVFSQYVLLAYLILYLTGEGYSAFLASLGLLAVQLGAVGGRMFWGQVSDRAFRGARKPAIRAIVPLASAAVASLAAISRAWPSWLVVLQLLLVGATALSWNGLVVTLIAELGGYQRAGAAIGLNSAAAYFGALMAAPLFGAVVDRSHSYRIGFLALACTTLLGLI